MTTATIAARTSNAQNFPAPIRLHCALMALYAAADKTATPGWVATLSCAHCRLGPIQGDVSFVFGSRGQVRHHKVIVQLRCPRCGEHLHERTLRIHALVPAEHAVAPNAE